MTSNDSSDEGGDELGPLISEDDKGDGPELELSLIRSGPGISWPWWTGEPGMETTLFIGTSSRELLAEASFNSISCNAREARAETPDR